MTNWLEKVVALNVKPNSLQAYKFRFEHYISPKIGSVHIKESTTVANTIKPLKTTSNLS